MLYCSNCKIRIQKKGQFCPKCGNPLKWQINRTLKRTWKISWYVVGLSYLLIVMRLMVFLKYVWYGMLPAYKVIPLLALISIGITLVVQVKRSKQLSENQIWKRAKYYAGISIFIILFYVSHFSLLTSFLSVAFCAGIGMLLYCLWSDRQISRK